MSAKIDAGPLFRAQALARSTDPRESKQAAREAVAEGKVTKARAMALDAVRATPGLTANELECAHDLLRSTFGRRLGELEKLGMVRRDKSRRCRITGRTAACWHPS